MEESRGIVSQDAIDYIRGKNLEERNQKVAEWCGFKPKSKGQVLDTGIQTFDLWEYPDGYISFLPALYSDLNALFKYTVPRLTKQGVFVKLDIAEGETLVVLSDYANTKRVEASMPTFDLEMPKWLADADTPAMALFLAAEKFISEKGE